MFIAANDASLSTCLWMIEMGVGRGEDREAALAESVGVVIVSVGCGDGGSVAVSVAALDDGGADVVNRKLMGAMEFGVGEAENESNVMSSFRSFEESSRSWSGGTASEELSSSSS